MSLRTRICLDDDVYDIPLQEWYEIEFEATLVKDTRPRRGLDWWKITDARWTANGRRVPERIVEEHIGAFEIAADKEAAK